MSLSQINSRKAQAVAEGVDHGVDPTVGYPAP